MCQEWRRNVISGVVSYQPVRPSPAASCFPKPRVGGSSPLGVTTHKWRVDAKSGRSVARCHSARLPSWHHFGTIGSLSVAKECLPHGLRHALGCVLTRSSEGHVAPSTMVRIHRCDPMGTPQGRGTTRYSPDYVLGQLGRGVIRIVSFGRALTNSGSAAHIALAPSGV
jgi:hypothetical protein